MQTIKYVPVACAIICQTSQNGELEILLIQRAKDDHWPLHWDLPRGKVEPGESVIQGLLRETKEETGLDVRPVRFLDKFQYVADNGTRISTQYNFVCVMVDSEQPIELSHEHQDWRWIKTAAEAELLLMPEMKKSVRKVFNDNTIVYPENQFCPIEKIEESLQKSQLNEVYIR